jgi:hypothetical protein
MFWLLYGFLSVKNQMYFIRSIRINDGVIYKKIYGFQLEIKYKKRT